MPSGDTINFIARWNGFEWKPLGKGVNCSVHALLEFNNELAVGGCITQAGDSSVNKVASWNYTPVSVDEIKNSKEEIKIFPNPFSSEFSIIFEKQNIKQATFTIRNILGQTVFNEQQSNLSSNYTKTINLNFLSKGIYLLDVNIDGERTVKKIVKE